LPLRLASLPDGPSQRLLLCAAQIEGQLRKRRLQ
jgi:hypothetical protein